RHRVRGVPRPQVVRRTPRPRRPAPTHDHRRERSQERVRGPAAVRRPVRPPERRPTGVHRQVHARLRSGRSGKPTAQ
ncbi:hypothetical protein ABTN50_20665, partial [Acinetobacter baumannii]